MSVVSVVHAAPTPTAGITVNPAIYNIALQPSQAAANFTVTLENDTAQSVAITTQASDFSSEGVSGRIQLKATASDGHGLSRNIQFSTPTVVIAPAESKKIVVNITNTEKLAPGGHFAVIRYKVAAEVPSAKNNVALNAELTTFIFLNTAGQNSYDVTVKADVPGFSLWSPANSFDLLFTNPSNTQTAPRGTVTISDPNHQQISSGIINPDSSLVLPGSTRLFQTQLMGLRTAILPGKYHADVYYRANENTTYKHVQKSFIVIGWPLLVAVVVGLLLLGSLFRHRKRRRAKSRPVNSVENGSEPKATKTPSERRTITVK